ncbi:MAG: single-stranded-DNA-specific exonuclease RecJ [Prevotellaceae bacterium]|jgi:single-stranded-DNA-specific exonuclease|nr:single-stranded-DNA-specific exonuclease RecJ [Prevotellaceae bacterium]
MIKIWNLNPLTSEQTAQQERLKEELHINPFLCQLLVQRGITTYDEAHNFFRPDLKHLHNPFLMQDMQYAVNRLDKAMRKKEKILIYGDYDVDGTTAVALVYKFIKHIYSEIDFYIPNRYTEGYGISFQGIDFAVENGFSLVIALDCGIKAVEKVAYAKERGVDFIICDHHTPDIVLPDAVAILNPKREDCGYPYKHLSGCGVGFKFMQAFCAQNQLDERLLFSFLDLVAVSIASDIVPITGENRILTFFGMKQLNQKPSLGLASIIQICHLQNKEITISDVVFKIGPRLNAAGRIESGRDAVELLVCNNMAFAEIKGDVINDFNDIRRTLDKSTTEEAALLLEEDEEQKNRKSIVIFDDKWHKGVVGIVASRLSEDYYKPSIVLTESDGMATGSARSVPGFDIYKAIDSCRDLLENFGGHMYAAGLTMKRENVREFKERFEKYTAENILPEQLFPQIDIDVEMPLSVIKPNFFKILNQFAPFGPGNMKPVFMSRNVLDAGRARLVGKNQEHLKLELIDESTHTPIDAIGFNMGRFYDDIMAGKPFDVCYTIEENTFNNRTTIQLMLKDIKM